MLDEKLRDMASACAKAMKSSKPMQPPQRHVANTPLSPTLVRRPFWSLRLTRRRRSRPASPAAVAEVKKQMNRAENKPDQTSAGDEPIVPWLANTATECVRF